MSNPNDYTVLWICALTTEYVAAQTFLDEEHPKPEADTIAISDTNAYTLGSISGHRVVLAVLPKGEYGVGSAASVITNILRSFANIRIGLMVGIGGGAPTRSNDIRLGDIVVSSPKDGHGGVYHYDLGKETQDSGFRQTGFLDQPPTVVRTAVSALESKHIRKGHRIIENIEIALKANPRLKKKGYACPASESDRLYKADVLHSMSEESCDASCGTGPTKLVTRQPRDDKEDDPAIHYGLIGSGNRVIKDAILRDKLAREEGVLCFEMEAAGIMNRFPCLVVRGICDYSDSHKNKEWQGYAAMTAAAYVKELLMEIPSQGLEREERLTVAIERLSSNVQIVAASLREIKNSDQTRAIILWLKATDPSVNYNKAIEAHHPGTGKWLLESSQFQGWKKQTKSFLWLHGLSGCGKTILSAAIIQYLLNEQHSPVIYFYFDFSDPDKQHFEDMLRSLLSQLYRGSPIARSIITTLFISHGCGTMQPSIRRLKETLKTVLEQCRRARIVLDALDEAHRPDEMMQWCRSIYNSETLSVQLLVTSQTQLVNRSLGGQVFHLGLEGVSNDIKSYTRRRLHSEEFAHLESRKMLRDEVETTICNKAKSMFRWAALQLDTLRTCHNRPAIEKALRNLPNTLNDTYARMLSSIKSTPHRREVILILQMLLWCDQRLTLEACNDAIVVQPDKKIGFSADDRFPEPSNILSICGGLVTTTWSNTGFMDFQYLQLAHASVREYLSSGEVVEPFRLHLEERIARMNLLSMCHTYLCCVDWSTFGQKLDELDREFPLVDWATSAWPAHAKFLEAFDDDKLASVLGFLQKAPEHFFRYSLASLYWADKSQCYPLYLAALKGLRRSCAHFIQFEVDACSPESHFGIDAPAARKFSASTQVKLIPAALQTRFDASLLAASSGGHDEIVQDLLVRGARPDASRFRRYNEEFTALHLASMWGHMKTVRLLIEGGASLSLNTRALCEALESGNIEVVKALTNLAKLSTFLTLAVSQRDERLVKLLLDEGISTKEVDDHGQTVLHRAVKSCEITTIKMLLDRGAPLNAPGPLGTALTMAAGSSRHNVVRTLLDYNPDLSNCKWHEPLFAAAIEGNRSIVEEILLHVAQINESGPSGTALYQAAQYNHETLVEILLQHKAMVDEAKEGMETPLQIAIGECHLGIMRLLIQGGANVNGDRRSQSLPPWIAFSIVSFRRSRLRRLLTSPHSILLKAGDGRCWTAADVFSRALTPLQIAVLMGSEESVKLLLESGADASKGQWYTPPRLDARGDYVGLAQQLLGSDVDLVTSGPHGTSLTLAAVIEHKSIIEQLIECLMATEGGNQIEHSPLQLASIFGRQSIIQMLLYHGPRCTRRALQSYETDVAAGRQLRSALSIAIYAREFGYNNSQVVGLLLEFGVTSESDLIPALLYAVHWDYKELVRQLLGHKVDINKAYFRRRYRSTDGAPPTANYTILRLAIHNGRETIVRLLVESGADINDRRRGLCPLTSAAARKQDRIMRLLVRRGADIELAIQCAWDFADAKKIARRLRRLQKSASNQFSECEEDASLRLLDSDCPQKPEKQSTSNSRPQQRPLRMVEPSYEEVFDCVGLYYRNLANLSMSWR